MNKLHKITFSLFAVLLTFPLTACIQYGGSSGGIVVRDPATRSTVSVYFSDRDRSEVHRYYSARRLPPGLAKKRQLPPGLQKQLARKGKLPPGLETHALPRDLETRLSPLPAGYIRLRVGTDLIIKNIHTNVIVDIISDIAR